MDKKRPGYNMVWKFSRLLAKVSTRARDEFNAAAKRIDMSDPEAARAELLKLSRAVLEKYGISARELGAQWYDYCRALAVDSGYTAITGEVSRYNIESDVGEVFGKVDKGEMTVDDMLARLGGIMVEQVRREANQAIMSNLSAEYLAAVERGDKSFADAVGFCRVPVDSGACAFCVLLASRSYYPWQLYTTKSTGTFKGNGEKFHENCRCVIMPFHEAVAIEGYEEKLKGYNDAYRAADDMWHLYDDGSAKFPPELAAKIRAARDAHIAERREDPSKPPWQRLNEELIIMRYLNPDMK